MSTDAVEELGLRRNQGIDIGLVTSPTQEDRLVLDRGPGGPRVNVMCIPFRVRGRRFTAGEIEEAWQAVTRKYDSLRSFFPGSPLEVRLLNANDVPMTVVEDNLGDPGILSSLMDRVCGSGFDLWRGPVAHLFVHSGEQQADCVLFVDHIAFDGISIEIVLGAMASALQNQGALVGRVRGFYPIAQEQRDWLGSSAATAALDHWKSEYQGLSLNPELQLPTQGEAIERAMAGEPERALSVEVPLSSADLEALRATPYATIASAILAAMWEISDSNRVGLMRPTPGRSWSGAKEVAGKFADVVPLGVDIVGGATALADVLQATKLSILRGSVQDRLPQLEVIRNLFPQFLEESDDTPYVYLDLLDARGVRVAAGDIRIEELPLPESNAPRRNPGLSITVQKSEQTVVLEIAYGPQSYQHQVVAHFAGRVVHYVEQLTRKPQTKLRKVHAGG